MNCRFCDSIHTVRAHTGSERIVAVLSSSALVNSTILQSFFLRATLAVRRGRTSTKQCIYAISPSCALRHMCIFVHGAEAYNVLINLKWEEVKKWWKNLIWKLNLEFWHHQAFKANRQAQGIKQTAWLRLLCIVCVEYFRISVLCEVVEYAKKNQCVLAPVCSCTSFFPFFFLWFALGT